MIVLLIRFNFSNICPIWCCTWKRVLRGSNFIDFGVRGNWGMFSMETRSLIKENNVKKTDSILINDIIKQTIEIELFIAVFVYSEF